MKRIAIVNPKGGSGKTTTALLFLLALDDAGIAVKAVDLDCQHTLTGTLSHIGKESLLSTPKPQYTITDTPARLFVPETTEAIKTADTVIVTSKLMTADFRTTRDCLRELQRMNCFDKAKLLFNQVDKRTGYKDEIKLLFSEAARNDFPELAVERIPQVIYMRSEIARVHDYGFRSMRPTTREEVDKAIFAALT